MEHIYICIDLKSFYASCECVKRGLDPLDINLVVADEARTDKTICLATSPSLKSFGLGGRCRLFEAKAMVKEINRKRKQKLLEKKFRGKSFKLSEILRDDSLEIDFLIAKPNMQYYIDVSTKIYNIYLKYVSKEDIHIYSIDEVFIDITNYLKNLKMSAYEFSKVMIKDVYKETKITATCGIGTNLFLAKVAMDIMAKKEKADKDGVRISYLDEETFRKKLWQHTPLTDFWRIGKGYSERLNRLGLFTLGDIAKCSVGSVDGYYNEDLLYKEFGVNAEILIDHAWGWESVSIADIKKYHPKETSKSLGQVLDVGYSYDKAMIIVKEMIDSLALDLVSKELVTKQITLNIGYDIESLSNPNIEYLGKIEIDAYGRSIPKSASGSVRLDSYTSSSKILTKNCISLFKEIVNPLLLIKRINISCNFLKSESDELYEQLSLFESYEEDEKEKVLQKTLIEIKNKFGKNSVLKGSSYLEGAKAKERNEQIGGHKA